MAQAPQYKVFDAAGKYQAACKEIEAAAALMGLYGKGASIRMGHAKADTVWLEGSEDQEAWVSYDHVAQVAQKKWRARCVAFWKKQVVDAETMRRLGATEAEIAA